MKQAAREPNVQQSGECENVDPDARYFFCGGGGSLGLTYACGNCDRCEDVSSDECV